MCNFLVLFCLFPCLLFAEHLPITLEHAKTEEQMIWGLMQRESLPENYGMLFHYPSPKRCSIWMFNCLIDLSVAFLDAHGKILEVYELKAYPEKMDPKRPVTHVGQIRNLYPPDDPIFLFFRKNAIQSKQLAHFCLEMNTGWFEKHGVKPGDVIEWDEEKETAQVIK